MDFQVFWFFARIQIFFSLFLVLLVQFSEESDAGWLCFGFSGLGFGFFLSVLATGFRILGFSFRIHGLKTTTGSLIGTDSKLI